MGAPGQTRAELAEELAMKFEATETYAQMLRPRPEDDDMVPFKVKGKQGFVSSWFTRLGVVLERETLQKIRNPAVAATQIFGAIVMGVILGSFYFQISPTDTFQT